MTAPVRGMMATPQQILDFWFGAPGTPGHGEFREVWFKQNPEFDAEIRRRFLHAYEQAAAGACDGWCESPEGCLALVLLLDQVPRNLFRGDPRAWATDPKARAVARQALERGHDRDLSPHGRAFLYMPFMHSEDPADQRRSLALFEALGLPASLEAARRHLEIVERFGRFPHRNAVLGRATTPEEAAFLQEPNSSF